MTDEEVIAQARSEFLANNPSAYKWADGTIDLVIPRTSKGFAIEARMSSCQICGTKFDLSDRKFADSVVGIKITCPCCRQVWFIHEHVKST